ncbi:MAG: aminotransferase class V-fold PLP-dependent enzyme [Clostridia bacterium]|nr:aminotransferase class V-fold PLP-dependent enzyme [Clostridia bacterium]
MIYLDNAATSFPKPAGLAEYMSEIVQTRGGSFGRGGYRSAIQNSEEVLSVRLKLADFLGGASPERIVFTKNATEALNTAIFGILQRGDRVIVSPFEHNSVMRPLNMLECNINLLPLSADGSADISALKKFPLPSLVILNHASNVSGVINDIDSAALFCKANRIPLLIDAAQSAGHIPINASLGAMIACAGHKGLLGPQGTGVLYIPENISLRPLTAGGTGNRSELLTQPEDLPDRFESGTLNLPAILGLGYSLEYIKKRGMESIHAHETKLTNYIISSLMNIRGITVLHPENQNRTPCISFYTDTADSVEFGNLLDSEFGIAVRCGLHCAPCAHKSYGTFESGTIRVSPGAFTRFSEAEKFVYAVNKIMKRSR